MGQIAENLTPDLQGPIPQAPGVRNHFLYSDGHFGDTPVVAPSCTVFASGLIFLNLWLKPHFPVIGRTG